MEYEGHDQDSTPDEIEQALTQGWHDDPDHPKYKTASEFLAVGDKIAPIAAKQNKRLEAKIAQMEATYKTDMNEMRGDLFKQEEAGYNRAMGEIDSRKKQAIEDEDIDAYAKADADGGKIEPPRQAQPKQEENYNPEFMLWKSENPWYLNTTSADDMAKTAYADAVLDATTKEVQANKGEATTNTDVLEAVGKKVAARFAAKQEKNHEANVEGGGGGKRTGNGKKDWRSLPKHIKDQAKEGRYVEKYFNGDKEAYAAEAFNSISELQGEKA